MLPTIILPEGLEDTPYNMKQNIKKRILWDLLHGVCIRRTDVRLLFTSSAQAGLLFKVSLESFFTYFYAYLLFRIKSGKKHNLQYVQKIICELFTSKY